MHTYYIIFSPKGTSWWPLEWTYSQPVSEKVTKLIQITNNKIWFGHLSLSLKLEYKLIIGC